MLFQLNWLLIQYQSMCKILLYAFKALNGTASVSLRDLIQKYRAVGLPQAKLDSLFKVSSTNNILYTQQCTTVYCKKACVDLSLGLWTDLPDHIKLASCQKIFWKNLVSNMDQDDVIGSKRESPSASTPNGHIERTPAGSSLQSGSIYEASGQNYVQSTRTGNIQNPDSRNSSPCESDIDEEGSCGDDDHGNSGDESDLDDGPEQQAVSEPVCRLANPDLPDTVTTLHADNGAKVYVVGTAHFSKNSQDDVAKTIQLTQPDVVVVELCSSRVGILQLNEEKLLEEAKNINFEKFRSLVKQAGMIQGIVHLLLLSLSAHLTEQLGMAPGGEFRRALQEAQKIPGCRIQLGDRPVGITLRRAIHSLSVWQKIQLMWCLLTSKEPISKEEVERCKQHDLLEEMMREMAGEFPALSRVFVQERDLYLVHSLRLATHPTQRPSDAEDFVPPVVVGVVGIGHVQGIVENWKKEFDVQELLRVPEGSRAGHVIKRTFQAAVVVLVSWGCFKLYGHLPKLPL